MATFELTEYAEGPVAYGNASNHPALPFLKHTVVTSGPGNEVTLQPATRFIRLAGASADVRFKLGRAAADVTGGNAPTATNSPVIKSTDPAATFAVPKAGSTGWVLGTV